MSTGNRRVKVLLADDHTLVRAGLRALLERLPTIEIVDETGDGESTVMRACALQPDVVVMDIGMPILNGLQATARLRDEAPKVRVLILSMHREPAYVLEALRAGASGYLLKESATAELELAIEAALRGETYLSSRVSAPVLQGAVAPGVVLPSGLPGGASGDAARDARLTPRQREILQRIARGESTKEIAFELGLSAKTVETHRAQLMERLGIHDVPGLVRYAIRIGLVRADS